MKSEPTCWGALGEELFPVEWIRALRDCRGRFDVGSPQERYLRATYGGNLARRTHWDDYFCLDKMLEFVIDVVRFLSNSSWSACLDVECLPNNDRAYFSRTNGLPRLPRTRDAIERAGKSDDAIDRLICIGSFSDLQDALQDSVAALDIMMTARAWQTIEEPLGVHAGFHVTSIASLPDLLRICQHRRLVDLGVPMGSTEWAEQTEYLSLSRVGLSERGAQTLRGLGAQVGLTAERIRQKSIRLTDETRRIKRVWPIPPFAQELVAALNQGETIRRGKLVEWANVNGAGAWVDPIETVTAILRDLSPQLNCVRTGDFIRASSGDTTSSDFDRSHVFAALPTLSKFGFARRQDLLKGMLESNVRLTQVDANALVDTFCRTDLPEGYVFCSRRSDPVIVSQVLRILSWSGKAELVEIREALLRLCKFRQYDPPPSVAVLREFFMKRDEFRFTAVDEITAAVPYQRDLQTTEGRIAQLVEDSPGVTMSKRTILIRMRELGEHSSSVAVFLTYGTLFKSVGRGCVTLVGYRPDATSIEDAAKLAESESIATELKVDFVSHAELSIRILVGTGMRNSGVVGVPSTVAAWFGNSSHTLVDEDGRPCGNLRLAGTSLYGLTSYFSRNEVDAGESILIKVNKFTEIAHISEWLGEDGGVE